jgi:acid phosphatase
MTINSSIRRLLVLAPLLLLGCTTPATHELRNLDASKRELKAYVSSGDYAADFAAVAAQARAWIETRAARRAPGEEPAVVLDIDETALSNLPYMKAHDFGWDDASWNAWIAAGEAPALAPVREVFATALRLGVAVFFITGREEPRDRPGTEKNLRAEGMGDYARLIMAPADGPKLTNAQRKTAARTALEREGWTIIANLGDQDSDLAGGHAERTFKLPDPFYLTE